jgi:DNA-binding transcriptional ArsR family regulator
LKVFRSLSDEPRLKIIRLIVSGTTNPGDIARAMGKHRSTVEKHLRVLLAAGMIQKTPGLNEEGH